MKYREPKNIRQKKAKAKFKKDFWRIFALEGGLFFITSVLAVLSAFQLQKLIEVKKIYVPGFSFQDFLFSFLLVTFFALLFISFKKASKFKELIYKGFFLVTCFWGGMTVLNSFIPVYGAILIMGILIVMWLEFPKVWVHDALIVLGLAGAASFFGLGLEPSIVIMLLVVFSFYDFIAVYKTKHMVVMAKDMIDKKVILGFIIPRQIKYFKDSLQKVKPAGNFLILGGGDVVFPNLLAVSVAPSGILKAFIIVLFSLAGSFLSYWIFMSQGNKPDKSTKRILTGPPQSRGASLGGEPIPALPPIALLTIIGYFVSLLF